MRISTLAAAFTLFAAPAAAFAPATNGPFVRSFSTRTTGTTGSTSSLSSYIDVNESAQRDLETFDAWATQCGVQRSDGFQLTTEDGLDWSILTTTDLAAGQPILQVPANMILTASNSRDELVSMSNGGVQAAVEQLGRIGAGQSVPQFYLFLKLLVEFQRGAESPYLPWLNSLPRLYYNAVSMTDFCYECLPPLVFNLSRMERVKFDNFMEVLKKVDIVSEELKEEKDICKWAFNAVHTRCRGEAGGEQTIVPMADMFNHGTETEIEINFDEEGNCNAFATRDVPAGSPLRMSYGCATNPSHFFATYGFLDKTAPATFCKMMSIQSTPELVNLGFDFTKMLFYKDTGDITEEVWDVVLYAKVLASNADAKQQFYEAHMTGNAELKAAIHQQFMLETASEIKSHVDTFLTQLDALSAKGDGKDLNEHPRLPLILRHNEFVKNTFVNVKARLDPMVEQMSAERGSLV
jgi:hypothetical protein